MSRRARFIIALGFVLGIFGCRNKAPYEGKSVAELERMLRDSDPAVQTQGAFGLGRLGPQARSAVPALIEALKKDANVRQNAARALGQIGPEAKEAVPALIDALGDSEWSVRRQAALALGQVGPDARPAVPALKKLGNDPDKLVRRASEEAIKKIQVGAAK